MMRESFDGAGGGGGGSAGPKRRRSGQKWIEEEAPPPVDLRLVPAALAAWAGAAAGLLLGDVAWWVTGFAALAAALLLAVMLQARRSGRVSATVPASPTAGAGSGGRARLGGWIAGSVGALSCLSAAAAIAALQVGEQFEDPLSQAASRGSWVSMEGEVARYPEAVDSGFLAPDNASGGNQPDVSRWRVDVVVHRAQAAGMTWASTARLTIYGQGRKWSDLVPGEVIGAEGKAGEQQFGSTPQIVLRARDPPRLLADGPWWSGLAHTLREELSANASRLSGDAAGLLPGLVVGDTSGISEQLDADGKATSIAHLLAVSGSHFAILCGIVVIALRRFGPRAAAAGGGLTLVGLVVLVGPEPSVLRAALMGGIAMVALLAGRTRSVVPALATAVIALVLLDPGLALSVGFTLSVLATVGLVLIAPSWSEALQRRGFPPGWADMLAIPAAAQVVTMPVIVLISGSVSVVGVLANILVAPVVAPALVLGMLCAMTGPWWSAAAGLLARCVEPLLLWIAGVAHRLARWPTATVPWPATLAGALLLTGLSIAAAVLLRHRRFRELLAAAAVGITLIVVPARVISPGWPMTGWLMTACEVGQGDAMVLSTGEPGTAVVVDTGPDPAVVDGCLDRLGVGTIPLLLLTHLHADHIDGLSGVLSGRSVGVIAVGPGREPGPAWTDVTAAAAADAVPLIELHPGMRWTSGDLRLTALAPRKEFTGTDSDPNNDSLVVMAEHGGRRVLLTGDIELEAQQALLNAGDDLRADVFKVPHHGSSKLLDRLVEAVSPSVAVIGVGVDNDYGHPSPTALDLLARHGVSTVLRTDQQGDVAVGVEGDEITVAARGPTIRPP